MSGPASVQRTARVHCGCPLHRESVGRKGAAWSAPTALTTGTILSTYILQAAPARELSAPKPRDAGAVKSKRRCDRHRVGLPARGSKRWRTSRPMRRQRLDAGRERKAALRCATSVLPDRILTGIPIGCRTRPRLRWDAIGRVPRTELRTLE